MPEDTRREPRVATKLDIRLNYGSVDDFIEGWALNLSRGGMFVRAREVLPPGAEIAFQVALASGDASVLEIQGDVYEVVSTGGDTFLGGVDFDRQLVDHLVWKFTEEHGFQPPEDRAAWQRIREAAEETKIALSSRESAVAHVPYLCRQTAPKGARPIAPEAASRPPARKGFLGRLFGAR